MVTPKLIVIVYTLPLLRFLKWIILICWWKVCSYRQSLLYFIWIALPVLQTQLLPCLNVYSNFFITFFFFFSVFCGFVQNAFIVLSLLTRFVLWGSCPFKQSWWEREHRQVERLFVLESGKLSLTRSFTYSIILVKAKPVLIFVFFGCNGAITLM